MSGSTPRSRRRLVPHATVQKPQWRSGVRQIRNYGARDPHRPLRPRHRNQSGSLLTRQFAFLRDGFTKMSLSGCLRELAIAASRHPFGVVTPGITCLRRLGLRGRRRCFFTPLPSVASPWRYLSTRVHPPRLDVLVEFRSARRVLSPRPFSLGCQLSSREIPAVARSSRKQPSMRLVTRSVSGLCMPRVVMQ